MRFYWRSRPRLPGTQLAEAGGGERRGGTPGRDRCGNRLSYSNIGNIGNVQLEDLKSPLSAQPGCRLLLPHPR
jgi:hypothetical protein